MNASWYFNRLAKMPSAEIMKRIGEYLHVCLSYLCYEDTSKCAYDRFVGEGMLGFYDLTGVALKGDWKNYRVYEREFDLSFPVDWNFSSMPKSRWPNHHFSRINYRPGNPYGDIRVNWELNRLQFLPAMAAAQPDQAISILSDWLEKNPYLHGPGYLSSMEVALRWISIYWSVCVSGDRLDSRLKTALTGLAASSGKYIEQRLSTYSSAGNHLIIEAVGLFWLGMALKESKPGRRWIEKSRRILGEQITRQIHPDGTSQEQSFWYLGFVLDALFHYFLMEDENKVPGEVRERVEKAVQFIDEMTLPDGVYPDYGDRDDGFVFRISGNYNESPFPGLLNTGSLLFKRPEWRRQNPAALDRLAFWSGKRDPVLPFQNIGKGKDGYCRTPALQTYPNGGMTLMKRGKGRLLFRHARLGLGNTCGHGHADALSVLFWWDNMPVLVDLGSGQYNGDQHIRNYFRSTIAHNTIEIGNQNQAEILGPFLWKKAYNTTLHSAGQSPNLFAEASHDGYLKKFSIVHTRRVEYPENNKFSIEDSFPCPADTPMRGAFHLGKCHKVKQLGNCIEVDFGKFIFAILFPPMFSIQIFYGSENPFLGWRSTVYGKWEPIHTVLFSSELQKSSKYKFQFEIIEKNRIFLEDYSYFLYYYGAHDNVAEIMIKPISSNIPHNNTFGSSCCFYHSYCLPCP